MYHTSNQHFYYMYTSILLHAHINFSKHAHMNDNFLQHAHIKWDYMQMFILLKHYENKY